MQMIVNKFGKEYKVNRYDTEIFKDDYIKRSQIAYMNEVLYKSTKYLEKKDLSNHDIFLFNVILKEELVECLTKPIIIAIENLVGECAGYAIIRIQGKEFYIKSLYIVEKERRRGLAKGLMKRIIEIGEKNKISKIKLETLESFGFIVEMYKKLKFKRGKTIPNKIGEENEENFVEYLLNI